jgi:hypothetical protein
MGLRMQVAVNIVYAQMHARAGTFEVITRKMRFVMYYYYYYNYYYYYRCHVL